MFVSETVRPCTILYAKVCGQTTYKCYCLIHWLSWVALLYVREFFLISIILILLYTTLYLFIYFLCVLFREALLSVSTSFFEEVELGSDEVKVIQFLFLRLSNLIFHPKHLGCCKTIIGVFWILSVHHFRCIILPIKWECQVTGKLSHYLTIILPFWFGKI